MQSAIQQIREAADAAPARLLDEEVLLSDNLNLYALADINAHFRIYVDVPIVSLVALNHLNAVHRGDTWRQATNRLEGEGWGSEVFSYFERSLRENWFPAPRSQRPLRLRVVGGATECDCGVHRIIAARSWLAARFGERAVFKEAKSDVYSVHPNVRHALNEATRGNCRLAITRRSAPALRVMGLTGESKCYLSFDRGTNDVRALVGDRVQPLTDDQVRELDCRLPGRDTCENMWGEIPLSVARRVANSSWADCQVANATSWE